MTVSLVAASTPVAPAAAAPQTGTPTLPAGTATGHRVFVLAVTEPVGTAPTLSANGTGWTSLNSSAPGSVQLTCWWRDKDASWSTMPTVSNAAGTSVTNGLIIGAVSFSTDGTWVTPSASDYVTGADATSDTALSITGSGNLGVTAGNYLFAFVGTSGNSQASAHTLTATGATLTAPAELADLGTSTGGGVGFKVFGAPVASGTETAAPVITCTLSGANTASGYFVRVRDTAASGTDLADPVLVREGSFVSTSGNMTQTTAPVPLGAAAAAGNLLVYCLAGDKNTGTLSMSDNVGSAGWVVEASIPGASVSAYIAWKVAVGGETTITGTVSTAPISGNSAWAAEFSQSGSPSWGVSCKAVPTYSDTAVNSAASGTSGAASYKGIGIALSVVDSWSNGSGGTWSNGYVSEFVPGQVGDTGGAPAFVGIQVIARAATTSTTFSKTPTGTTDQMTTTLVVFGRQGFGSAASGLTGAFFPFMSF